MKVMLVDDSKLFLAGLQSLLEASDVQVLGQAHNAADAVRLARQLHPEVVLMDVQMPGQSGIEATRVLKLQDPSLKIVMMTVSEKDEHLFDAIAAGASGYLLKNMSPAGFVGALEGLVEGEAPLAPGLAGRLLSEFARREREVGKPQPEVENPLNERQMEILRAVARGFTYKEIAAQLDLSEQTIKYHMSEIAGRLHLSNRSQVIAYASRYFPNSCAPE